MGESVMHLYGVLAATEGRALGPLGREGEEIRIVARAGLGIALREGPPEALEGLPRDRLLPLLVAHQSVLEDLMQLGCVIPLRFGTCLAGEEDVQALLAAGHGTFVEALDRMRGFAEYEVAAYWPDMGAVFASLAALPDVSRLREEICSGGAVTMAAKRSYGALVAARLTENREDLAAKLQEALAVLGPRQRVHPVLDDSQVLTASVLVPHSAAGSIRNLVHDLAIDWEGQVDFRLIGPLPPHSFCTLAVRRPDPAALRTACRTLELPVGTVTLAQVRAASRRLAAEFHPDGAGAPSSSRDDSQRSDRWTAIQEAHKVLSEFAQHVPLDLLRREQPVFVIEQTPEVAARAPAPPKIVSLGVRGRSTAAVGDREA
jgi:hypothetical protein